MHLLSYEQAAAPCCDAIACGCREEQCEQSAVLHYTYNRFEDLKSRRDRCDCAPTEEDAKRCFILPFDRAVCVLVHITFFVFASWTKLVQLCQALLHPVLGLSSMRVASDCCVWISHPGPSRCTRAHILPFDRAVCVSSHSSLPGFFAVDLNNAAVPSFACVQTSTACCGDSEHASSSFV